MKKLMMSLLVILLMAGCGDKKIDASTDEAMTQSIEEIKESLSGEKKKEFSEAVKLVALSGIGNLFAAAMNPDGVQDKLKEKLQGKTADEVIAAARSILAERRKKEQQQALDEIVELRKEIAELEMQRLKGDRATRELKKLQVLRSRFSYEKGRFRTEAVIELKLKNNTGHAISRAYFSGVLSSPGRSIPWVKETFNYSISGGLEPGEKVTWNLTPNMFGGWSKAPKNRKDMILTVDVTRIDGADGKAIYDAEFSKRDEEELADLKQRLVKLKEGLGE